MVAGAEASDVHEDTAHAVLLGMRSKASIVQRKGGDELGCEAPSKDTVAVRRALSPLKAPRDPPDLPPVDFHS